MGMIHPVTLSAFAKSLHAETAFDVLAIAKALKAKGKDVVELQIGDSPFATPASARSAGIRAIESHQTHLLFFARTSRLSRDYR